MKATDARIAVAALAVTALIAVPLGFFYSPLWLLLFVVPVVAVSVMRGIGMLEDLDEYHRLNNARAGNIALYTTVLLAAAIILEQWISPTVKMRVSENFPSGEAVVGNLLALILVAAFIKILFMLVFSVPYRRVAVIFSSVGALFYFLMALVAGMAGGFPKGVLLIGGITLGIIILTILSCRFPRTGGSLLIALGIVLGYMIINPYHNGEFRIFLTISEGLTQLISASIPFVVAGILFIASHWQEKKERAAESAGETLKPEISTGTMTS